MTFELHPRLQADTACLGNFPLSSVLLVKDATYPWCMLVPRRADITEIHHLDASDRKQFIAESCVLAEVMEAYFKPYTMNIGALGNIVSQLHLHHVARYQDDAAWPAPMWGREQSPYTDDKLLAVAMGLSRALAEADPNFQVEFSLTG